MSLSRTETFISRFEIVWNYYQICYKEVTGPLTVSTSSHARLAAVRHSAEWQCLQAAENL